MCDLVKRLDIKSGVMEMGEKIAWGSDTALMREAARKIEAMQQREARLIDAVKIAFCETPVAVDGVLLVPVASYNRIVDVLNT